MNNNFTNLQSLQHFISLQQAIEMTTKYRKNLPSMLTPAYGQETLAICETFNKVGFETLLAKAGCVGIRIYYGMDAALKVHAIIVAVNENGEDILSESASPGISTLLSSGGGTDDILDDALRCPTYCPPPSPLNG